MSIAKAVLGWLWKATLPNWLMVGMLIVLSIRTVQLNDLREWRGDVLDTLSHAVDQRDAKGQLLPVEVEDATRQILALGRFKTDTAKATAQATADDAFHTLAVAKQDDAINRKASDDFASQIAAARAEAARLRAALAARPAGGVQPAAGARRDRDGKGGGAAVPSLSVASGGTVAPSEDDGFSSSATGTALICTPLTIDERLLATEQALQLDALIDAILGFAEVPR